MQEGWKELSQKWINAQVDTMVDRLKDCLNPSKADGDMTGYFSCVVPFGIIICSSKCMGVEDLEGGGRRCGICPIFSVTPWWWRCIILCTNHLQDVDHTPVFCAQVDQVPASE